MTKTSQGLTIRYQPEPIDSKQLSFAIWLGLPLHQFQKNWLLSDQYFTLQFDHFYALAWYQMLRHAMIYRIGIGRHMMAKGDGLKEKLTLFRFYLDKTRKKSKSNLDNQKCIYYCSFFLPKFIQMQLFISIKSIVEKLNVNMPH